MPGKRLTKEEALELITPVVDGEVGNDIHISFLDYIEHDPEVLRRYQSMMRIKALIRDRCPRQKAPARLRLRVTDFIQSREPDRYGDHSHTPEQRRPAISSVAAADEDVDEAPGSRNRLRPYSYAAGILLIAGVLALLSLYNQSAPSAIYQIEEYAYRHFENNKGEFVEPVITSASLVSAEQQLRDSFNLSLKIPPLKNMEFKGVAYTTFIPGFEVPLLEYFCPSKKQYIYIFAFKMNQLEANSLSPCRDAVKSCKTPGDFYVKDMNDKHVVSWMWNDTWYTAVSHRSGEELASLVEPLSFNSDTE